MPAQAVSLTPYIPADLDGTWVQLVDAVTCTMSAAVPLCDTLVEPGAFVGSYAVMDGPAWGDDGPPYSCIAACAEIFGGVEGDYQCSTSDTEIDNLAYLDGWGDTIYCTAPQAEDFVVGTHTNCGGAGCYYSAWVMDHSCDSINNCWTR